MANSVAYGFIGLQQLFDQRADLVDVAQIQTAITETTRIHSQVIAELMSAVVVPETRWQWRYDLPGAGTLQPLDEWGDPLPTMPAGYYDVALPIQRAGDAYGTNRETRALMTVGELEKKISDATRRDIDWMKRHLLAAWMTKTGWTYNDERWGDLSILPLANNDTVTYLLQSGLVTTDNHYIGQANAIDNSNNPFPAIYTALAHHPSNSGPYIAYCAPNLTTSIEALTALDEPTDSDVIYSTTSQRLNMSDAANTNKYGPNSGFGEKLIGKANGVFVREWAAVPDSYIIWHAVGAAKPFGMRQQPVAELQGFFPEFFNVNGNLHLNKLIRIAGFGALNRVAAGATYIGNATYANPAALTAPLKV